MRFFDKFFQPLLFRQFGSRIIDILLFSSWAIFHIYLVVTFCSWSFFLDQYFIACNAPLNYLHIIGYTTYVAVLLLIIHSDNKFQIIKTGLKDRLLKRMCLWTHISRQCKRSCIWVIRSKRLAWLEHVIISCNSSGCLWKPLCIETKDD